jgi:chloride channel protein, CIC family
VTRRARARLLAQRLVQRGIDWLHGTASGMFAVALAVGAGAGLGAIIFRALIGWFTQLFTGHADYSAAGHAPNPFVPFLGMWFVVLAPVVGGLIYGPIIQRFAKEARGHGVPEVMLAVAERGGRIRPQVAVVKSLASALCIGSGGSVGREGPIVQIGSALGSTLGQWLRVSESRLRLLVSCGAAGGISATFNAPIAGVFFALELILQDFAVESFGAVVLASVTADIIGRAAFGSQAFLTLPGFHIASNWEYGLYAVLGVLGGFVGIAFIRVLYGTEDFVDRIWHGPEWLRPAVGGVFLGLLLLALPQLYGVGYPVIEHAVQGNIVLWLLAALLAGKMIATSLTIGIGGSGGVFAPSLFMGSMLGTGFGLAANTLFHGAVAPAGAYGLVGMGAVFAGAARAPITAVIIIFELTGDYTIILPLMIAIVISASLSNLLSRDTIYTLKLRRRGIELFRGRAANLMQVLQVRDAMQPMPEPVAASSPLNDIIDRFARREISALPVVDERGAYRGVVTARQVEGAMRDNAIDVTASELAETPASLAPDTDLEHALRQLIQQGRSALPVIDARSRTIVGWLTHRDLLAAYNARLERSVARAESIATAAEPVAATVPLQPMLPQLKDFRIVDVELSGDSPPVGSRVADVHWPARSLVLAVRRNGSVDVPNGDTTLERGDRLTVLVPSAAADELAERIAASPAQKGTAPKDEQEEHHA